MKKSRLLLALSILSSFLLSSCSGFNAVMRKHLSDPNNYYDYEVVLNDYECYSYDHESCEIENANRIFFDVTFTENNENTFYDNATINHSYRLEVTEDNNKELVKNDFYSSVSAGDTLLITASNWIYMDGNFFYIIELKLGEVCYLDRDTGLNNIIDMMNNNKSIF